MKNIVSPNWVDLLSDDKHIGQRKKKEAVSAGKQFQK